MPIEIDAIQTVKSIGWTDALLSRLAANSVGLGARLSITAPANASALSSTGYSLTGSNAQSMIDLAGTWNTTGTPTLIKANVTNTASNASSLLMDLQSSASSKFAVSIANGGIRLNGDTVSTIYRRSDISMVLFHGENTTTTGIGSVSYNPGVNLGSAASLRWTNDTPASTPDVILLRDAANTLALRNAANAQAFNVYNTYTSGSVYERGFMRWVSNVLEIGTEHVGASARGIALKIGSTAAITIATSGNITLGSGVNTSPGGGFLTTGRGGFYMTTDGVMKLQDNADTGVFRLCIGGTTSSFPAIKRSSTVLQARLADDSAFAPFAASTLALTAPTDSSVLSSTGYSLTGSNASSMIDLAGTLNTTGSPAIIKVAMSNTASGATTKFMEFLAGASGTTSVFSVDKVGLITSFNDATNNFTLGASASKTRLTGIRAVEISCGTGWDVSLVGTAFQLILGGNTSILTCDAANTLALRNAANAQAFNIYNTYTSGSVYERGFMRWVSNVLEIGTEHVGASVRSLKINFE